MPFSEKPPPTIPPDVPRFYAQITPAQLASKRPVDVEMKPMRVQVEYEERVRQYLIRMAAAIP